MPGTHCFSYSDDVPLGIGNRSAARRAVPDLPRRPVWPCFSYSADLPLGIRERSTAPQAVRDLPTRPAGMCFSYTTSTCFTY
jgi:hypothetical protein